MFRSSKDDPRLLALCLHPRKPLLYVARILYSSMADYYVLQSTPTSVSVLDAPPAVSPLRSSPLDPAPAPAFSLPAESPLRLSSQSVATPAPAALSATPGGPASNVSPRGLAAAAAQTPASPKTIPVAVATAKTQPSKPPPLLVPKAAPVAATPVTAPVIVPTPVTVASPPSQFVTMRGAVNPQSSTMRRPVEVEKIFFFSSLFLTTSRQFLWA